jgi:hypothetical protein
MGDREFSDIQIFQHSGKGIPLFIIGHKNYLQADYLLGPVPRLKKKLPGRGLTKVEKHCSTGPEGCKGLRLPDFKTFGT